MQLLTIDQSSHIVIVKINATVILQLNDSLRARGLKETYGNTNQVLLAS